jgi:hypothetical protein
MGMKMMVSMVKERIRGTKGFVRNIIKKIKKKKRKENNT